MVSTLLVQAIALLATLQLAAAAAPSSLTKDPSMSVVQGEVVELPDSVGVIGVYAVTDEEGTPTAIGLEYPLAILTNPQAAWNVSLGEHCVEDEATNATTCFGLYAPINLAYPQGVEGLPFTFQSFWYNPAGHEPLHIYSVEHLDVHFYLAPPGDVAAIAPGPCLGVSEEAWEAAMAPIPEECFPSASNTSDYANMGSVVPGMGNHLINLAAPEFSFLADGGPPTPFTETFVFGSMNGSLTYLEPMLTTDFLLDQSEWCAPIPGPPENYAAAGYYPTSYCVFTDDDQGMQRVELQGMAYYEGGCGGPPAPASALAPQVAATVPDECALPGEEDEGLPTIAG